MSEGKRILIVGGSGFVGTNLARDLSSKHSVACTYHDHFTALPGVEYHPFSEFADRDLCKSLVRETAPEFVIYAVGSNEISLAEKNPREAQFLHTAGAALFQKASETVKARFIYLSNETVFSGHGGNFAEGDTTIPASSLGKAKLASENHIRGRSLDYMIVRSAPLMGRGALDHPSWVDRFREKSLLGKKIILAKRVLRNPVHIHHLSSLIQTILERDLKNQTLHLAGLTKISEYDLGKRILQSLSLDAEHLEGHDFGGQTHVDTVDYSLNTSKTLELLKWKPITLADCLEKLIRMEPQHQPAPNAVPALN